MCKCKVPAEHPPTPILTALFPCFPFLTPANASSLPGPFLSSLPPTRHSPCFNTFRTCQFGKGAVPLPGLTLTPCSPHSPVISRSMRTLSPPVPQGCEGVLLRALRTKRSPLGHELDPFDWTERLMALVWLPRPELNPVGVDWGGCYTTGFECCGD
ncbi:hypothetical protein GE09DRAFT_1147385 [Coniochaeta sp. 2T2.1]|nr:hypothetical protein GE09DRAFT_1147385 [Coniochaeta sp. 2T2.1]